MSYLSQINNQREQQETRKIKSDSDPIMYRYVRYSKREVFEIPFHWREGV